MQADEAATHFCKLKVSASACACAWLQRHACVAWHDDLECAACRLVMGLDAAVLCCLLSACANVGMALHAGRCA